MDINTCFATTETYRTTAYYSHLIPVFITAILTIFVILKSKTSLVVKIFSAFTASFCIWLIFDVVIWTANTYDLVVFLWAPLDYVNILFYLLGAYFFAVLIRGRDIGIYEKIILLLFSLPAWWVTIANKTIASFNQPVCEALNSNFLTNYKLIIEAVALIYIVLIAFSEFRKAERKKKFQIWIVGSALILFFCVFSATEYFSSVTGIYEMNLYSLFVLPIFLFMIIYSITDLQIFQLRLIGTQLLTYIMIALVGSQFFFLENTTNQILTLITFVLALSFGVVLSRDARRELKQRERLEKLTQELASANTRLKELDEQKSQFLSFASHDLKSPINIIKQFATLIADGTYKEPAKVAETINKIRTTADRAAGLVDDFLDIRKIEEGKMDYAFETKDLISFVRGISEDYAPLAKAQKNIEISFESKIPSLNVKIDTTRFRQVIQNLLSNSLKYTETGWIKVLLTEEQNTALITVKDSGIGMEEELLPNLFEQFSRAPGVAKKIQGTGLGLYISKQIVKAHQGEIWAESEGKGKGSSFFVRLKKA
jgi:signal transduction histidine kinase